MRYRRKRIRRKNGSLYVMKTKRKVWISQTGNVNRRRRPSLDWTELSVWSR